MLVAISTWQALLCVIGVLQSYWSCIFWWMVGQRIQGSAAEMSKCRRCRELFRSVLRSVQAIKLLKDSVCKMAFHKKTPEFFDSPTYQFEQDGIDSSAAPQPGATSWDYGPSFFDTMDDFFPDPEYSPPALTIESIDTGLPYPTNLEPTNLELQTELSWIHQTGEPFYDTSHNFTPHPLGGDLSLLHEQGTAMYGTDETVSALLPLPEPNYEVVALLNCNTSGSPASMLQTSTFNWSEIPVPQNYQDLTSFVCQTIDAGPPYDRHVECEQVAEGDDWYIPRVPQTQARRLGWCTIRNMVRACKIFLSRIRSRMVRILPHPSKSFCHFWTYGMIVGTSNSTNDFDTRNCLTWLAMQIMEFVVPSFGIGGAMPKRIGCRSDDDSLSLQVITT